MIDDPRNQRIPSGWLAAIFVIGAVATIVLTYAAFNRSFSPTVEVTVTSDRSGLVMEPYAKVKLRGVQVGHVAKVSGGSGHTALLLALDGDQVDRIPANVEPRIASTSVFGAKYVDLVYPEHPDREHITAGAVLRSQNVATEVNTVFQNLVALIDQIDPAKLNAVLSAVAEGVRGQGPRIGEATTSAANVLTALNSRSDVLRDDWRAVKNAADTYGNAAQDILDTLSALTTTGMTVVDESQQLDALLVSVVGMSQSGINLLGPNSGNLVTAVNRLAPTTALLLKYNPELTCTLVGAQTALDKGLRYIQGGNGRTIILDAQLLLGDDPYRYPDNLPINAAKGGPGGKPGCGSLPDVANNWPVRYLVTNSGWGTGLDVRPNPGIGFPGWTNYFPVTRAVPEPPSIRNLGGPAPGPIPYPGAPPYGAAQYGPDGSPLYPGVPPIAPPPMDAPAAPPPP